MDTFVIQGGRKLQGSIRVGGAKNAAGPILAATTLIHGECVIHNVPRIADVETLLEILKSMKARVLWDGDNTVRIDCTDLDPSSINETLVSKVRVSVFLISCLAQRFGHVKLPMPGGCNIGSRPLDAHFEALSDMGYDCVVLDDVYTVTRSKPSRSEFTMPEFSVTATENVILASVLGETSITVHCAATEPHVQDLCWFLETAGASISHIGQHDLTVRGVSELRPVEYTLMSDPIEVGTFIVMALATQSEIRIENACIDFLRMELKKFEEIGAQFTIQDTAKSAQGNYTLATVIPQKVRRINAIKKKLHDMPYPGFSPDLIQPFALLMTQAEGTSLIQDWMYDGRMRYVSELKKMGADITVLDPHRILVVGPTPLYGKEITSFDLRAGATLVIAALIAAGESKILNVEQVDRGYERLDARLKLLGADIKREVVL